MDERQRDFIDQHSSAAMITLRPDGSPHAVRVAVGLIDGKLWSSGTETRRRTQFLRRDPRATLFVFDDTWRWLALETTVTLIEGPDVPELSLRFFQHLQRNLSPAPSPGHVLWYGQEKTVDDFLRIMVEEQHLIYQF